MTKPVFEIGADGVDSAKIVSEIQASVAEKLEDGAYADARIARAERHNLANLQSDEEFLEFYLTCLREAATIDITDFEIRERRKALGWFLVPIKKLIWKLLKFYTYRLWSQQNELNGMMVTALEGLEEKQAEKVAELEARIVELEARLGNSDGASSSTQIRKPKAK